ncbi:hypothetical protein DFJ58DRAFT_798811 [Suillus subalutaceus]|uniref:uncharacterized protein n=1 Tax=Suillus subalutaceus TaxID=48586 RepID=UPI001B878227|nr:uncharacterized protein DFJ58DRAFT_798811 [Suillus subalutaceus]KAG1846564.1 hypothetical protein DFJ58DRAFT_798811 [Suillus subalutaceus]
MSMHLHKSGWTPTSHPSTSSWLDVVEQCTNLTNDGSSLHHRTLRRASGDQDSTTSTLRSCLKLLDQHCDRLNSTYKETLEIRARIAEILANSQSEVAMGNVGTWDSSVDLIFVALNERDANSLSLTPPNLSLLSQPLVFQHLHSQPSAHEYESLLQPSVGVISSLPEGTDPPIHRFSQEPLLPGASGSVSYELGTQPFQKFLPEDDTCSEELTLSDPSVRHHLYLPVVQDDEDKVKCMWLGCSSVIRKDNYTRHVNEVHRRQFKAVCAICGKEFLRPYMKKTHICPGRYAKRSNS